jgi:hypothetical protein
VQHGLLLFRARPARMPSVRAGQVRQPARPYRSALPVQPCRARAAIVLSTRTHACVYACRLRVVCARLRVQPAGRHRLRLMRPGQICQRCVASLRSPRRGWPRERLTAAACAKALATCNATSAPWARPSAHVGLVGEARQTKADSPCARAPAVNATGCDDCTPGRYAEIGGLVCHYPDGCALLTRAPRLLGRLTARTAPWASRASRPARASVTRAPRAASATAPRCRSASSALRAGCVLLRASLLAPFVFDELARGGIGQFANVTGLRECYACDAGLYQSATFQAACNRCPLGRSCKPSRPRVVVGPRRLTPAVNALSQLQRLRTVRPLRAGPLQRRGGRAGLHRLPGRPVPERRGRGSVPRLRHWLLRLRGRPHCLRGGRALSSSHGPLRRPTHKASCRRAPSAASKSAPTARSVWPATPANTQTVRSPNQPRRLRVPLTRRAFLALGSLACTPCKPGWFANTSGLGECYQCPTGAAWRAVPPSALDV